MVERLLDVSLQRVVGGGLKLGAVLGDPQRLAAKRLVEHRVAGLLRERAVLTRGDGLPRRRGVGLLAAPAAA